MLLDLLWAVAGVTAALLVLRGARSWFRLYLGSVLAVWATTGGALVAIYGAGLAGSPTWTVELLQGLGWCGAFALAYLFPDGRFVPRWSRWCVLALALYLPWLLLLEATGAANSVDSMAAVLPLFIIAATGAYAAVHRYRTSADREQRRQVRGVMAALVLWLGVVLVRLPLAEVLDRPTVASLLGQAGYQLLSSAAVVLLCASVVVAVLRHRLYEVDVWVNRALVYGTLTALVALLYAVSVALGGLVWRGNGWAAALVATCLLAVLLHPLRLRVQRLVDRFVYGHSLDPHALLADLRESRERILRAREDERARLQRDLHDGLGPTLASLYQRVDAARGLVRRDPAAAEELLEDVGTRTRAVIGEIRTLVRALRPPELDELGLAGSIRAAAGRIDGVRVTVDIDDLPPLGPVVEIAAYRIATEALTNVARHAGAQGAWLRLEGDPRGLRLVVRDDGTGLPDRVVPGAGLRSMRERAEELGGTLEVHRLTGGGTRLTALLPGAVSGRARQPGTRAAREVSGGARQPGTRAVREVSGE